MHPAVLSNIPIFIRNSFHSSHPGTKIWAGHVLPRRQSKLRRDLTTASERSDVTDSSSVVEEGGVGGKGISRRGGGEDQRPPSFRPTHAVKGLSVVSDLFLVNIEGSFMMVRFETRRIL